MTRPVTGTRLCRKSDSSGDLEFSENRQCEALGAAAFISSFGSLIAAGENVPEHGRCGQLRTWVAASKHYNAGTGIGGDARCPHAPLAALCHQSPCGLLPSVEHSAKAGLETARSRRVLRSPWHSDVAFAELAAASISVAEIRGANGM
jgi:hypothetical protein